MPPDVQRSSAEKRIGVTGVEVSGFRTVRHVAFAVAQLCALVGEADAGKSNLLAAIRAVLDPATAPVTTRDAAKESNGRISIRATLAGGGEAMVDGTAGRGIVTSGEPDLPVVFLPAEARGGDVLVAASVARPRHEVVDIFRREIGRRPTTSAARALSLVDALESCRVRGVAGSILLIEEPELFLRPQAQRYLYRLLREFARENQVIYSTHSPAFLNVARLDELVFVERLPSTGTHVLRAEPVSVADDFRVMTEFDADRSELFLARAAVLVEGQTEKLVLPFVFSALGYDIDREGISIIECGGKPNIPFFARICTATGTPLVVIHDSDRRKSGRLSAADSALNTLIAETAGAERVIVLDPDFEAAARLSGHKPERAWRDFATRTAAEMPPQLVRAAELAARLARPHERSVG
jgi:hypothetical protein